MLVAGIGACVLQGSPTSRWSIHTWQSDDGLPNNNVTGLTLAADGYLWVATLSGPARFDGVAFESFLPQKFANGLTQKVVSLLQSPAGLWMGLDHGHVVLLDGKKVQVFSADLPDRVAEHLCEDREGTLWIAYRAGSLWRLKEGKALRLTAADGLPEGYAASMAKTNAGELYLAKRGTLGVIRQGRVVSVATLPNEAPRIAAARDGGVWIAAAHRLFHYREGRLSQVGSFQPKHHEAVPNAVLEDRRGGVWVGTSDSGLFHFGPKGFEQVPVSHLAITGLTEDEEGNVWVGTDGGGLNRVRPRVVALENASTGLPFETVQSLTEDATGTVWATTFNGLLLRRRVDGWDTLSAQPDWPGGRATCVAADRQGGVWIGTKDRFLHYWRDGTYRTWRREDGLASRTIHAMTVARNGDLWLGEEMPDVVQRLRDDRFETFQMPPAVRIIRAMTEDSVGAIWAGTSQGTLVRIHDGALVNETRKISTPAGFRSIRYLYATPDGLVWIAFADEGLGLMKGGVFHHLTSAQGLPDDNLSQIVADDRGWLWFGGNRGIFKARRSDLEDVALGRVPQLRFLRYGPSEGLRSLQANFGDTPGALCGSDGRIWMPMRTALAAITPEAENENAKPPAVLLTRIGLNEQTLAWLGGMMPVGAWADLRSPLPRLYLPPDHRRLDIAFSVLSFSAPENVRFRYRLEGFDDDWVDGGRQRHVSYPRLPKGDYRFRVTACNSDGVWNETGTAFAFTVRPFFWQTWWFQALGLGVLLCGVAGSVRYAAFRRFRRRLLALEQQAALDRERARIARDIHDDLGSRLTHATLLVELAQRSPPEKSGEQLHDIAATVREVSESLDDIIWAVNPRNDVFPRLIDYVIQFAVNFLKTADIRCRVDVPTDLPPHSVSPEVRHHLLLVVKEAVTNVARHSRAREVWLRLALQADGFQLTIEDKGCGCQGVPDDLRADGVRNMRQRMKEIGGEFRLTSQAGQGTTVALSLAWAACATVLPLPGPRPDAVPR